MSIWPLTGGPKQRLFIGQGLILAPPISSLLAAAAEAFDTHAQRGRAERWDGPRLPCAATAAASASPLLPLRGCVAGVSRTRVKRGDRRSVRARGFPESQQFLSRVDCEVSSSQGRP